MSTADVDLVQADHMNQFHKLLENGAPGDSWGPLWGRNYNGLNCAYTIAAIAARFATRNAYRPSPNDMRQLAEDHEGGAMPPDVRRALEGSGRIDPSLVWYPRAGLSWDKARAFVEGGRYVWIATDYELIPDAKSCQPSFDGDHAIGMPPLKARSDGRIAYNDPLCDRLKWIEPGTLRKAAAKSARNFGSSGLLVVVVKQRPAKERPANPAADRADELEAMLDEANSRLEAIRELAVPVTEPPTD